MLYFPRKERWKNAAGGEEELALRFFARGKKYL
jgi:hypothetical protein